MKEVELGIHEAGHFIIQVCACVFDQRPVSEHDFFEVMVSELHTLWAHVNDDLGPTYAFYVDLVEDARFSLFSHMTRFERAIHAQELIEFNAYVQRRAMTQRTWKLSRATILDIVEKCSKIKREPRKVLCRANVDVCVLAKLADKCLSTQVVKSNKHKK